MFKALCKRTQHYWLTTPSMVGCYMLRPFSTPSLMLLGDVAQSLKPVKRLSQQLPTMLGPAVHRGKEQPTRLWRPCVMRMRGPNNFGRAVPADPTLFRYAFTITEQKKC